MPFTLTRTAALVWRDYVTDGVPASGKHRVEKGNARTWGGEIEDYLDGTSPLDQVDIDGGAIDGTPIGANAASTGAFTTLTASEATIGGNLVLSEATPLIRLADTDTSGYHDIRSGAASASLVFDADPGNVDLDTEIIFRTDAATVATFGPTGVALGTGPAVNTIETTLTDDDTHLPTSGAVFAAFASYVLPDGDYGDFTITGGAATLNAGVVDTTELADSAVTLDKMADMATDSFLGRNTAGTGAPEVLTPTQVRTILNVEDGATASSGSWQKIELVAGTDSTVDLSAYRNIRFNHIGQYGLGVSLSVQARDGAGTWRTLASGLGTTAGTNDTIIVWGEISNFNNTDGDNRMSAVVHAGTNASPVDTSDAENEVSASSRVAVSFRGSETWDALRIVQSAGGVSVASTLIEGMT